MQSLAPTLVSASFEVEKELSRRLDHCQEELVRERSRSEELAAELHEARLKSEDTEVQQLRQQLAIRDRELVAAAAARQRCAAQSAQLAASLRSKLTELEAHLAPCSPSMSSGSSHRGATDRVPLPRVGDPSRHAVNGFRGPPGLDSKHGWPGPTEEDAGQRAYRWHAVGPEVSAPPEGPVEDKQKSSGPQRLQAVAQQLFQRFDARGCGTLSWRDGEVMDCLRHLLMAYRLHLPELSKQSLSSIYSQVKSTNSEVEGLDLVEMCQFAQKVWEVSRREEENSQNQDQQPSGEATESAVAQSALPQSAWSWNGIASD